MLQIVPWISFVSALSWDPFAGIQLCCCFDLRNSAADVVVLLLSSSDLSWALFLSIPTCGYKKYGHYSMSLLLHWQGVQIATLLNRAIYAHKLPRYPFAESRTGKNFLSYWIKEAVKVEPPALRNPYIGRTPGTIDHKGERKNRWGWEVGSKEEG